MLQDIEFFLEQDIYSMPSNWSFFWVVFSLWFLAWGVGKSWLRHCLPPTKKNSNSHNQDMFGS